MANAVSLEFPDGSVREYDAALTGAGLAESISKSLAKKAVAYAIDGVVRDLVLSQFACVAAIAEDDDAVRASFHLGKPVRDVEHGNASFL